MFDKKIKKDSDILSNKIIGCAIEVHKHLGPGLLESAYESCLCYELSKLSIPFKRQLPLSINYKDVFIEIGYKIDLLVDNLVIVELKCVDEINKIHTAQLLTYLKLSNNWLGFIINFNVTTLKNGIHRLVLG
jgi:GxxExxY protein